MLNINTLVKYLKRRIPAPVYQAVEKDWFIETLIEETLPLYSSFYPKVVKGIVVTNAMGILTVNPTNNYRQIGGYAIPMEDKNYPFIDIATSYMNFNETSGTSFAPGPIDSFIGKVTNVMGNPTIRYTTEFEAPNIVKINPAPTTHVDFTINLKRVRRLSEVKSGYHDMFKRLYEAQCKVFLYYELYNAKDGGSFGGVELKDYVSDFKDYESVVKDITEEMEEDYYKDPDMIEEIVEYNRGYLDV